MEKQSRKFALITGTLLLVSLSTAEKAYPLGCSHQDPSYYNYDSYPFPPPNFPIKAPEDYQLLRKLGSGKFSDVFEAVDVQMEKKLYALDGDVDPRSIVVLKVSLNLVKIKHNHS